MKTLHILSTLCARYAANMKSNWWLKAISMSSKQTAILMICMSYLSDILKFTNVIYLHVCITPPPHKKNYHLYPIFFFQYMFPKMQTRQLWWGIQFGFGPLRTASYSFHIQRNARLCIASRRGNAHNVLGILFAHIMTDTSK